MNPLLLKVGIGLGVGVFFSAAVLVMFLLNRPGPPPQYTYSYTESNKPVDDPSAIYGCSICLEDIDTSNKNKFFTLGCGHKFHKECVKTWFKESKNKNCPVCRAAIDQRIVAQCYGLY